MKSVTSFLRRKGYGLLEIEKLLRLLQPTAGHNAVEFGGGGALDEILVQLKEAPEWGEIAESRVTLQEAGMEPVAEYGHTLRIPLSRTQGSGSLCCTRVADDKWVYHVHPAP